MNEELGKLTSLRVLPVDLLLAETGNKYDKVTCGRVSVGKEMVRQSNKGTEISNTLTS